MRGGSSPFGTAWVGSRGHQQARRLRIGAIQAGCAAAGAVLAFVVVRADLEPRYPDSTVVPLMLGMGFSIVGLVTILFSLLFTVVQWVYGTFSLRLRRFEDRPIAWWAFGLTIGVFVYSVMAALFSARQGDVSWLVPAGTFAGALVALVLLRQLQVDAFLSVQLGPTLMDLCAQGLAAVDARYPHAPADEEPPTSPVRERGESAEVHWRSVPGVLQRIDERGLAAAALTANGFVEVTVPVGAVLSPDALVARVWGDVDPQRVTRALVTGPARVTSQDPQWVLRLLADITLKALSPAINDPATALQAMDCTQVVLARLLQRDLAIGSIRGPTGEVVVTFPVPSLDEILAEVFDDLLVAAAALPQPSRRVELLLAQLPETAPAAAGRAVARLRERAAAWTPAAPGD